eukprot:9280334-Pyramimonas_sp.AAC.1
METHVSRMEERIQQVEATLGIMAQDKPHIQIDTGFNREPNRTIIVARCKSMVQKQQIGSAIEEWVAAPNLPSSSYDIVGEPAAKRLDIQFGGTSALAARRATQALMCLNRGPNDWRRFKVSDVDG